MIRLRIWALGLLALSTVRADVLFYSIATQPGDGPRNFNSISQTGAVTPFFDLGDGSVGFDGGLTYDPGSGLFYAIANNGLGDSTLFSFSATGASTLTPIGSLGQGFVSGLAYSNTESLLYVISTDSLGQSVLNRITLTGLVNFVGILGTGFYGGLTFGPSDQLYAFSDAGGAQRDFQSIEPGTGAATFLFELGDGSRSFNGGVTYNAADGRFYAISTDWLGLANLDNFLPDGTMGTSVGIGGGFFNRGLTLAPETVPAAVPEPATWQLLAATAAGFAAGLHFLRR